MLITFRITFEPIFKIRKCYLVNVLEFKENRTELIGQYLKSANVTFKCRKGSKTTFKFLFKVRAFDVFRTYTFKAKNILNFLPQL